MRNINTNPDLIQKSNYMMIFGRNSFIESVYAGKIPSEIYISDTANFPENVRKAINIAKDDGAVLKIVPREKIDVLCGGSTVRSGGICASFPPIPYANFHEICLKTENHLATVVIADGISDPNNLGAIIRTCECAGVTALIIPERDSAGVTPAVFSASAGAAANLPVCRVGNLNDCVRKLKDCGFWIYAADGNEKSVPYNSQDYKGKTALVIGAEGSGISPLLLKNCDFAVKIPMLGKINSLNASVAAGILIYEILRSHSS